MLGVRDTRQFAKEALGSVHKYQIGVQLSAEHLQHLFALPFAHQPVVHVHTVQLLTDRADQQRGDHRGVHPAGQREQHLAVAHLTPDPIDLVGDKRVHVPGLFRTALVKQKRPERFRQCRVVRGHPVEIGRTPGGVVDRQHRHRAGIDRIRRVHEGAVHDPVGTAVEDHPFEPRQREERLGRDVVRVDFAIDAQSAHGACQSGVVGGSGVENRDHILLHLKSPLIPRLEGFPFCETEYHGSAFVARLPAQDRVHAC